MIVETGSAQRPGNQSEWHDEAYALWNASVNGSHWEGGEGVLGSVTFPQMAVIAAVVIFLFCLLIIGMSVKSNENTQDQTQANAPSAAVYFEGGQRRAVQVRHDEARQHPLRRGTGRATRHRQPAAEGGETETAARPGGRLARMAG